MQTRRGVVKISKQVVRKKTRRSFTKLESLWWDLEPFVVFLTGWILSRKTCKRKYGTKKNGQKFWKKVFLSLLWREKKGFMGKKTQTIEPQNRNVESFKTAEGKKAFFLLLWEPKEENFFSPIFAKTEVENLWNVTRFSEAKKNTEKKKRRHIQSEREKRQQQRPFFRGQKRASRLSGLQATLATLYPRDTIEQLLNYCHFIFFHMEEPGLTSRGCHRLLLVHSQVFIWGDMWNKGMFGVVLVLVVEISQSGVWVWAEADPRGFTEDPYLTEEKFREKGKRNFMSHLIVVLIIVIDIIVFGVIKTYAWIYGIQFRNFSSNRNFLGFLNSFRKTLLLVTQNLSQLYVCKIYYICKCLIDDVEKSHINMITTLIEINV